MRFKVNTWEPMELPASLQLKNRMDYFEGTFVQFGLPIHTKGQLGVRSLAHVGEKIWIAHEAMSAVLIADVKTGHVSDFVVVDTPIGLYHAKGTLKGLPSSFYIPSDALSPTNPSHLLSLLLSTHPKI